MLFAPPAVIDVIAPAIYLLCVVCISSCECIAWFFPTFFGSHSLIFFFFPFPFSRCHCFGSSFTLNQTEKYTCSVHRSGHMKSIACHFSALIFYLFPNRYAFPVLLDVYLDFGLSFFLFIPLTHRKFHYKRVISAMEFDNNMHYMLNRMATTLTISSTQNNSIYE